VYDVDEFLVSAWPRHGSTNGVETLPKIVHVSDFAKKFNKFMVERITEKNVGLFSERERSLNTIARPSVCLSSVTFVYATYSGD